MTKRLIWLCPEFTPYHEVLFRAIGSDPNISLTVEVMMGQADTHPYILSNERPYAWSCADQPRAIDRELIKRILNDRTAEVVIASYINPTLTAVMRALAAHKRRFIYYTDTPLPQAVQWNSGFPRRRSWVRRLARKHWLQWIFSHAHRVLATGRPGVEAVVKLGCPPEKAVVFPYWVQLPSYGPGIPGKNGQMRFLSVGQLIYRKGYDVSIKAFAAACARGGSKELSYRLIGDGAARKDLERLAREVHMEGRITFSGWLQQSQIALAMQEADVFIHPARWDAFGVAVLEAMAAGLPVLGSDATCAAIDRVEEERSGLIHKAENVKQLGDQMLQISGDAARCREMGKAARRKAEEWPPEKSVEIIKSIIF